ncbi:MAG: hypothetical protein KC502_01560 [Myxococcales bacterium]|nr:hypothetical protein [Myxococcales bacterium]
MPHPTGFPLFHLGTHPLILVPIAPLGMRMHGAGMLAAVAACGLWWRQLNPGALRGVPWLGALLLPLLAPSVALHVRAAEIYPWVWLHAALIIAAVSHLHGNRLISALWALGGLGVLIHVESAGLSALSALAVTAWRMRAGEPVARGVLLGCVVALLAGLGLGYLPLAAARNPALSWGDVRSFDALWAHLTAASIRQAFAHRMGAGVGQASAMLLAQLWRDLGPLMLAAIPGAALLLKHQRVTGVATLAICVTDALYAVLLNPMGLRDGQVGLICEIGVGLLGWHALVAGSSHLIRRHAYPNKRYVLVTGALLAVLGLRTAALWQAAPNDDLRAAAVLADDLFADTPPGSLLMASGDQRASSCIWQQAAVGARPDSPCIPIVFTRAPRMANQLPKPHFSEAAALLRLARTTKDRAAALGAWLRPSLQSGPVFWERGHGFEDAQVGDHLIAGYPWDRIWVGAPDAAHSAGLKQALQSAQRACERTGAGSCKVGTPTAAMLGAWSTVWGAWLLRRRSPDADDFLERAVQWAPESAPALNNLAVLRMNQRRPGEALELCKRALQSQPDYRRAHRTAARAALRANHPPEALDHARIWVSGRKRTKAWLMNLVDEAVAAKNQTLADQLSGLASADE